MSARKSGSLVEAMLSALAVIPELAVERGDAEPWDGALPEHRAPGLRRVRVGVGGAEVDRVYWHLPATTAEELAMRMYFGLPVRDDALIDAAVTEFFCRVAARALEADETLRITQPPAMDPGAPGDIDRAALGVTVRIASAAGPFSMNLLMPPE